MKSISLIERKARDIFERYGEGYFPINVELIAKNLGLEVKSQDLGNNVSGVLFIKDGRGIIGFNEIENISIVRKRFTIAHEIGHYILHRHDQNLFVDHKEFKAMYRDSDSSKGEIIQEKEANAFAAAILMPKDMILKRLDKMTFDLGSDEEDSISVLANEFNVSSQAMNFRLRRLNLFY